MENQIIEILMKMQEQMNRIEIKVDKLELKVNSIEEKIDLIESNNHDETIAILGMIHKNTTVIDNKVEKMGGTLAEIALKTYEHEARLRNIS